MDKKTVLRIYAKDIRKSLDIKTLSEKAVSAVRTNKIYKSAQNVMLYYPLTEEIDLRELLKDDKTFYLPKVDGQKLLVCPYDCSDKLEKSCLNINEPCSDPVKSSILDLIIVPALAVDKQNYRLGYGGGFYDRFLAQNQDVPTLTVIPKQLVLFEIPIDKYDVKINNIIKL